MSTDAACHLGPRETEHMHKTHNATTPRKCTAINFESRLREDGPDAKSGLIAQGMPNDTRTRTQQTTPRLGSWRHSDTVGATHAFSLTLSPAVEHHLFGSREGLARKIFVHQPPTTRAMASDIFAHRAKFARHGVWLRSWPSHFGRCLRKHICHARI